MPKARLLGLWKRWAPQRDRLCLDLSVCGSCGKLAEEADLWREKPRAAVDGPPY